MTRYIYSGPATGYELKGEEKLVRPGDEVVREVVVPRETVVRQSRRIRNAVERAVGDLIESVPACAPDVQAFLAALDESSELLSGPLRPAIWLVRRRD